MSHHDITQILQWQHKSFHFFVNHDLNSTCNPGLTFKPAFPALQHHVLFKLPSQDQWCISPFLCSSSTLPRAVCVLERRVQLLIEPVILMRLIPHVLIELLAFFYFSLRSCASGLISRCRPPLSLSLHFSQSKESSNSNLGDCYVRLCVCVCLDVYVHVCVCTKAETNTEHWEQLTSVFFSALLLIAFSQSAEIRKQNKHEQ